MQESLSQFMCHPRATTERHYRLHMSHIGLSSVFTELARCQSLQADEGIPSSSSLELIQPASFQRSDLITKISSNCEVVNNLCNSDITLTHSDKLDELNPCNRMDQPVCSSQSLSSQCRNISDEVHSNPIPDFFYPLHLQHRYPLLIATSKYLLNHSNCLPSCNLNSHVNEMERVFFVINMKKICFFVLMKV